MDEKNISSRAFSKCELHIEIDGNELNIPLNFGMTDEEVRKLYPYLLSVSSTENNPMISYAALKESGKLEEYPEDVRERYEQWAKRMSKYWYDKPTTSLLDVGIGLALDMKYHGVMLGDVIDPPETAYDGFMENPINPDPQLITEDEIIAIEEKYNIKPNSQAAMTLKGVNEKHSDIAGNVDVNLYNSTAEDDFISAELDALEADIVKEDPFAAIIENDYNNANKARYEMTYEKGKKFSDNQFSKDGVLRMYGNNDMFDKIERESLGIEDDETDENSIPLEDVSFDEDAADTKDVSENIVSFADDDDDTDEEDIEAYFGGDTDKNDDEDEDEDLDGLDEDVIPVWDDDE